MPIAPIGSKNTVTTSQQGQVQLREFLSLPIHPVVVVAVVDEMRDAASQASRLRQTLGPA